MGAVEHLVPAVPPGVAVVDVGRGGDAVALGAHAGERVGGDHAGGHDPVVEAAAPTGHVGVEPCGGAGAEGHDRHHHGQRQAREHRPRASREPGAGGRRQARPGDRHGQRRAEPRTPRLRGDEGDGAHHGRAGGRPAPAPTRRGVDRHPHRQRHEHHGHGAQVQRLAEQPADPPAREPAAGRVPAREVGERRHPGDPGGDDARPPEEAADLGPRSAGSRRRRPGPRRPSRGGPGAAGGARARRSAGRGRWRWPLPGRRAARRRRGRRTAAGGPGEPRRSPRRRRPPPRRRGPSGRW